MNSVEFTSDGHTYWFGVPDENLKEILKENLDISTFLDGEFSIFSV